MHFIRKNEIAEGDWVIQIRQFENNPSYDKDELEVTLGNLGLSPHTVVRFLPTEELSPITVGETTPIVLPDTEFTLRVIETIAKITGTASKDFYPTKKHSKTPGRIAAGLLKLVLVEDTDYTVDQISTELQRKSSAGLLSSTHSFQEKWFSRRWGWSPMQEQVSNHLKATREQLGTRPKRKIVYEPPRTGSRRGKGHHLVPLDI